ncbi:MAG: ZIP family metal transporter [Parcubacteria group bacterium]|nr:ZIP family metal transporter [Parcubacteria group bacterium]
MSEIYLYTLGSVAAVSAISFVGLFALSWKERFLRSIISFLVALAVGALLGDAFIHLIPQAFAEAANPSFVAILIIAGIVLFFLLETLVHWHHAHSLELSGESRNSAKGVHIHPTGYMVLVADGLHNFIDGIIIAVSYLVSIEVGVATTIAVVLHEIPQEIGDFGVLLHAGFGRMRALFLNFVSATLAILGAIIALVAGESIEQFVFWVLPLAAASFIYIATADLFPELRTASKPVFFLQLCAIILGVAAMYLLVFVE